MGRTILAEDNLLHYLTSLVKSEEYTIGLILGQSTEQTDFVFHLTRTPPPAVEDIIEESFVNSKRNVDRDNVNKCLQSINGIPESWVADHAKHVTRMLPGGTYVLGIFIVGPGDPFVDNTHIQKLRSVLLAIYRNLEANQYLYGTNIYEHLVLSYNYSTKKYICKSTDVSKNGIFKPADWKFLKKITQWHKLETVVDLDRLFLIFVNNEESRSLRNQLQEILTSTAEMINTAQLMVNDSLMSPEDTLEVIAKLSEDKNCKNENSQETSKPFQISLYIPCKSNQNSSKVQISQCDASMRLLGHIVSHTFVHQKATMAEIDATVKQDIIRSLASRLQMHWDSLIEEENGSPEDNITYHEPPRRVLIELPQSKVTLSDYLFPGEGAQEALMSLQELLDLRVLECNVQKDLELQVDTSELYMQSKINIIGADRGKRVAEETGIVTYFMMSGVALIVLIVAIFLYKLNYN